MIFTTSNDTTEYLEYPIPPTTARRIWVAVLTRAIEDLTTPKLSHSARNWFISNVRTTGSFLWTCQVLGYSATAIRSKYWREIYSDFILYLREDNRDNK